MVPLCSMGSLILTSCGVHSEMIRNNMIVTMMMVFSILSFGGILSAWMIGRPLMAVLISISSVAFNYRARESLVG